MFAFDKIAVIISEHIHSLVDAPQHAAVSIGNFDGLHLGHRKIIQTLTQSGLPVVVLTFEPHPLTVLRPDHAPPRLTPESLKLEILESLGVDHVVLLRPERELLDLSARAFYEAVRDGLKPKLMAEGSDFYFGNKRSGTISLLKKWCAIDSISLSIVDDATSLLAGTQEVSVSSSLVRWLLLHGRTRDASQCLGDSFSLRGKVVHGNARGRTIGFPTANLDCGDQLIPADAVYAAMCTIDGRRVAVALSIGSAPTFQQAARQVEAHLIDFQGDLYGRTLTIHIGDWIREQQKFISKQQLIDQLQRDVLFARRSIGESQF